MAGMKIRHRKSEDVPAEAGETSDPTTPTTTAEPTPTVTRTATPAPEPATSEPEDRGIVGTVRLERDPRAVGDKVGPGDVVVIEQPDLDRRRAEELADRGVAVVLNVVSSVSPTLPTNGPLVLTRAGVVLVDEVGPGAWNLKNGDTVRVVDGVVHKGSKQVASGTVRRLDDLREQHGAAEQALRTQLSALSANAADHLQREHELLLDGSAIPYLDVSRRGRPYLVVSRTHDWSDDLAGLRRYIRSYRPVLVGAGAGADALLEAGHTPEVVIGPLDELSDRALSAAQEVVVTTSTAALPPLDRLERLGVDATLFPGVGTAEDLAILLADTNEASLVVLAGAAPDLRAVLEPGPNEAAAALLSRVRAGSRVVDAKALGAFYRQRASSWPLVLLALVAVAAVVAAIATTPVGQDWFEALGDWIRPVADDVRGWFA
jgi:uncharacterized membrane-anchored protein